MKYIRQFSIILLFSLTGDLCHAVLPLPIPASIYGMVLLLLALATKALKVEAVKETGAFLVGLLPLLFVVPTVGLMACWSFIQQDLWSIVIAIIVTTTLTFGISGLLTKLCRKGGEDNG